MTSPYSPDWAEEIARYEARRTPITYPAGYELPAAECDLTPYLAMLPPPAAAPEQGGFYPKKRHALQQEFTGQPALTLLHAEVITTLRKSHWPEAAPHLFRRLWVERGEVLLQHLSTRWLISAAITFADHGQTEAERNLGQSLKVMFSLLKLTEFERLYSGHPPEKPFRMGQKAKVPLPLGLEPFSLKSGGLDVNLLAPLVMQARATPVLGPLALALLQQLAQDQGTVFARLGRMRARLLAREG